MNLKEMIFKRKSTRGFLNKNVDSQILDQIKIHMDNLKPLNPNIHVEAKIISGQEVTYIPILKSPHYIVIFSEEKDNYLENVGFMFQQLDLYIQSLGLGSCWLGMGQYKYKNNNKLKYIIMISFGYPKESSYRTGDQFARKGLDEIMDKTDVSLECARLAPSAVNSQPWYFIHDNDIIHIYRKCSGLQRKLIGEMNHIDIGIALAHIYVTYKDTFDFFFINEPKIINGYEYSGSFKK